MAKIIPNTFQTPNAHVDEAMRFLTGEQYKVLNFAVRHIYGWQDRPEKYEGRIAVSVFLDGFTTEEGKRYYGCGLSRNTIIDVLKDLTRFGLLTKRGEPTEDGQRWTIGTSPKWDLIATEHAKRETANASRAQKMNEARARKRHQKEGVSSDIPVSSHDTGVVSCDDTPGGSCDDTHIKPSENHLENHAIAPASNEADAPAPANQWPVLNEDDVTYPFVEKRLSSSSVEEKGERRQAEKNTPPIPSSARPLSSPRKPMTPAVSPSPKADVAKKAAGEDAGKKRSPKQIEQTAAMNALASAMGVTLVKADEKRYAQIAQTLVSSGITYAEFELYVKRIKETAKPQNGMTGWTVTVDSLIAKGRPSEYVTARDKHRAAQEDGKVTGQWTGDVTTHEIFTPTPRPMLTQEERIASLQALKNGASS